MPEAEHKDQVKIRFVTREDEESLPEVSPTPLFVPVSLRRFGLSEIVNHLMETEKAVPFEFIINGNLLKGSLEDYLVSHALSTESFLTLEYTRAVLPPKFLASFNDEDWVSSIDTLPTMTANDIVTPPKILTGSYDGIVRIYNEQGKVETQLAGHQQPVKAVKFIGPTRFVTAGMDRSLRIWRASAISDEDIDKDTQDGHTIAILDCHSSTVSSLDVEISSSRILSGGYDNKVALWSTLPKEMSTTDPLEQNTPVSSASRKRLKLSIKDSSIKHKLPLAVLESHREPVEGVLFDPRDATVGYSVSQDHTVKTWDLVTARCVDTKQTGFALLSVAALPKLGLLATGSSARHINLHDPRSSKVTNTQLVGHTNFVVSLVAPQDNEYMLLSGSHDGTVKVWDVRANSAIYTITRQSETKSKVLAVAFEKEIGILSGATDNKLQINSEAELRK